MDRTVSAQTSVSWTPRFCSWRFLSVFLSGEPLSSPAGAYSVSLRGTPPFHCGGFPCVSPGNPSLPLRGVPLCLSGEPLPSLQCPLCVSLSCPVSLHVFLWGTPPLPVGSPRGEPVTQEAHWDFSLGEGTAKSTSTGKQSKTSCTGSAYFAVKVYFPRVMLELRSRSLRSLGATEPKISARFMRL